MTEQQIKELLIKYQAGQNTPEEEALLFQLMDNLAGEQMPGWTENSKEKFIQNLDSKMAAASKLEAFKQPAVVVQHQRRMIFKWLAAASVILILSSVGYYLFNEKDSNRFADKNIKQQNTDVAPGKSGAILVLENGRQFVLDSLKKGIIVNQNGTEVILKEGELSYTSKTGTTNEIAYNILQTPKGRQFLITLPDGTKAWLNASSSLRYPTVFAGRQRNVQVTGEVYFEVAKNKQKPFIVEIDKRTKIEVLGTHFNVNAYSNENQIRTTLLEGSVRVVHNNAAAIIKPGQQARTGNSTGIEVQNTDTEEAVAWKDGYFQFNNADLQTVLRQLVRWYDVEVKYAGSIPDARFIGQIPRSATLSQVLKVLSNSGVHFSIENKNNHYSALIF